MLDVIRRMYPAVSAVSTDVLYDCIDAALFPLIWAPLFVLYTRVVRSLNDVTPLTMFDICNTARR